MAKLIARIEDGHVVVDRTMINPVPFHPRFGGIVVACGYDDYCLACNGTGENQFDVGRCGDCKGSGFHS